MKLSIRNFFTTLYIYIVPLFLQKIISYVISFFKEIKTNFITNGFVWVIKRIIGVMLIATAVWHITISLICAVRIVEEVRDIRTLIQSENVELLENRLYSIHVDIGNTLKLFDYLFILRLPYLNALHTIITESRVVLEQVYLLSAGVISDNRDLVERILTHRASSASRELWYTSFTPEERLKLLEFVIDLPKDLTRYQVILNNLVTPLEHIGQAGVILGMDDAPQIAEQYKKFMSSYYESYQVLSTQLASIIGYPDTFRALLLIQNSDELRPTGGFIGTIGTLQLKNGQVQEFAIDNVYNLDTLKDTRIKPPLPFSKYGIVSSWYLRDSNWSPDFPTAARDAIRLFEKEKGLNGEPIDMVVAINPGFILSLLDAVGGVEYDGVYYTRDNFLSTIESHTGKDFKGKGIDESNRKDILGAITNELLGKVVRPQVETVLPISMTIIDALNARDIILFSTDPTTQTIWSDHNWDGALTRDEFAVIDANLGSLKTDPAITREYIMNIVTKKDLFSNTIKLKYAHTKFFDWKTTRYQDYIRLYLPRNAQSVIANGLRDVYIERTATHTIVNGYTVIEPKTEWEASVSYTTPMTQIFNWHMQPGKINDVYTVRVNNKNVVENYRQERDIRVNF